MPEPVAAPDTGTAAPAAPQSINTLTDAWKAAQAETAPAPAAEPGSADLSAKEPEAIEQVTGEPEPVGPAPDPPHIDWVKRVSGLYDPQKGEFNVDRLAQSAYELNRQNQLQAQSIAKIEALLQRPEVLAAIQQAQGVKPPPQESQKEPQTDQEILADFIQKEVQKTLGPKLNQLEESTQFATQRQVLGELARVREVMNGEFGKAGDQPLFQAVLPQIMSDFEAVAQQNGVRPDTMIESLVKAGRLESTLRSMAKSLLYDRLQQDLVAQKKQAVTVKKGLQSVPKGSSQAKPVTSEPSSIAEAYRLAKEAAASANKGS